ncbi:potassium/sodium efflux P-type ATPase,TIGR01523 [Cyclonatronum proteinivorum]|uniref:Potassium/sodium efflux P-type ATPase,TIGR01523 n=1 Tax=Cyclonatronum proteinivorum TaxID=1457365 RepID=A0A345UGZ5_9BACT|nr:cation-transporting P-type ATPase [Cyclonatronum proteinivorum]AXI99746.1 potassium/sodium efflux P-type ATPase,TIGR01523 [Cyclonatronum proteinivorum]
MATKWHTLEAAEALDKLQSSTDKGLTPKEAEKRLQEYGPNKLPEKKGRHPVMQFLAHFHNVLIYILLVAAVVTALMDHWIDTIVILAVVLANAIVGFVQEGKAEKALEGIKNMLSLDAQVIRDGKQQKVNADAIVPGDIVRLRSGDKVPADVRIIEAKSFRVEESPLTGESTDVRKTSDSVSEDAVVGDRKCMAFSGTMVTYGTATGVVVETGLKTELGKITKMLSEQKEFTTPLLQKIDKFAIRLSVFVLLFSLSFFLFGYFFRDYTTMELFMATIGIVVASIPEGLPAIITITLAVGVQRMASRKAIIRRLPSVETLGSVSVICSDKTGTLTRNEMTVRTVVTADAAYEVEGSGYQPEGDILKEDAPLKSFEGEPALYQLLRAVRACNDAAIEESEGQWKLNGTPTEGALITLAHKAGLAGFSPKRLDDIPFESEHKYMATLNAHEDKTYVFVKGAPERLMDMCAEQLTAEGPVKMQKDFWTDQQDTIARRGQRVLGVAFREVDAGTSTVDHEDLGQGLTFLGLTGIIDPPRDEAVAAIEECKAAGIRVIMITGDHAVTAEAIAKELGIDNGEGTITGAQLEKTPDDALPELVMKYNVFARTSPEHKLRLVKALQAKNKLCAMTGDGVNDAPALKRADIGIAMGIKGTEVSKEAAEMVLADDNFATITNAVEEGRTVYDNFRKTILYILPTNGAQAIVLVAAIFIGIEMPITPAQILWVNMVTAVTLALALAFEPMEKRVMEMPPRRRDEPTLGGYFIWRIIFVSVLIGGFTFLLTHVFFAGVDTDKMRTIAVNTVVAGQVFYLFNCRQFYETAFTKRFFSNKYIFIAIGVLTVLQLLFIYAPFMNTLFYTVPLGWAEWSIILSTGVLVLVLVELEKWIFRSRGKTV